MKVYNTELQRLQEEMMEEKRLEADGGKTAGSFLTTCLQTGWCAPGSMNRERKWTRPAHRYRRSFKTCAVDRKRVSASRVSSKKSWKRRWLHQMLSDAQEGLTLQEGNAYESSCI